MQDDNTETNCLTYENEQLVTFAVLDGTAIVLCIVLLYLTRSLRKSYKDLFGK